MTEEIVTPLMVVPAAVPKWESLEAARLIADARLTVETAQSQIRRFAQKKWINTAGQRRSGPTAANLFDPTAVATAKVLSVLTALGVEDMGSAARGLWAWSDNQPILKGYGSPIMAAMAGLARNEWWVFQLTMFGGSQTGQLQTRAWVYDPDASWRPESGSHAGEMLPLAAVTVPLPPLLLPLHTRMMEAIGQPLPAKFN